MADAPRQIPFTAFMAALERMRLDETAQPDKEAARAVNATLDAVKVVARDMANGKD